MDRIKAISNKLTTAEQEPAAVSYAGKDNSIGIISLNHEKTYNALTPEMRESLLKSLKVLETDPKVKVICLRSLNPKVFCAGANIKEFENAEHAGWINNDRFKELDL